MHHRGELAAEGTWWQGELVNQDGSHVGSIRLRYDAEKQVMISQCC